MMKEMKIKVQRASRLKPKPDARELKFGRHFTDHMFLMDYEQEKGWHDPRIVPYGPLEFEPATAVFHYGQATFEGLKAYRSVDGRNLLFRPDENAARLNVSNERMCMPKIEPDFFVEAIKELVRIDQDWIPTLPGTSLYIRPLVIATENFLGLKPSNTYKFIIILSPVAAYYPQGINPVKIFVETEYCRAVKGGTGFAKTSGNYAASLQAQANAAQKGYVQVLWLDALQREKIEEVGAMNVFFKIKGEVITPSLEGSILPGITRDSVIQLLKYWGIKVRERAISIKEVIRAWEKGELEEAFGTGTAAVISPIGELCYKERKIKINGAKTGPLAARLYDQLTGIQSGRVEDPFGWTVEI